MNSRILSITLISILFLSATIVVLHDDAEGATVYGKYYYSIDENGTYTKETAQWESANYGSTTRYHLGFLDAGNYFKNHLFLGWADSKTAPSGTYISPSELDSYPYTSAPNELWPIVGEEATVIMESSYGNTVTINAGEPFVIHLDGSDWFYSIDSNLHVCKIDYEDYVSGKIDSPGSYVVHVSSAGGGFSFTVEIVENYTVSFSSEGSIVHTETVEPDSKVQSYTPPAREGYTFGGWYTDTTFQTPFDFNTSITSNITLYAKWVENPVTITFMVEGAAYSTLVVPKGSVGVVYTPIMVTGVFAGWYYDSALTQKYDATRALDADITLYAYGVPPLIFTSEPNATANIQQVNAYNMFFFDATDSSGRYQIEWDFGDGNTSTDAIAYNTYAAPGLYTVTLKITNIYGETSTATYDVLVKDPAGGGDNDLRYIVIALLCILGGGLVIRRFI